MQISFQNKNVVITGAASGIGQQTAQQFIEAGATVLSLDMNNDPEYSEQFPIIQCDVSDEQAVRAAFERIQYDFGRIDILVNNAGIQTYGNVVDTSFEVWRKTLNVNLDSVFLCVKFAIPLMESAANPVIVNLSSAQSFVSQKGVAAYAASKAAVNALTRCIAIDFAPKIRCVALCPGAVYTPMLERDISKHEDPKKIIEETEGIHLLDRIGKAEEIANFILFLANEKAGFATGHAYRVDGGIGLKIEGT